jgi:hypothetical protein
MAIIYKMVNISEYMVITKEVYTFKQMLILVFWAVTPCGLLDKYQRFGETCCLHLQSCHLH